MSGPWGVGDEEEEEEEARTDEEGFCAVEERAESG